MLVVPHDVLHWAGPAVGYPPPGVGAVSRPSRQGSPTLQRSELPTVSHNSKTGRPYSAIGKLTEAQAARSNGDDG